MKKTLAAITTITALTLGAVACGGDSGSETTDPADCWSNEAVGETIRNTYPEYASHLEDTFGRDVLDDPESATPWNLLTFSGDEMAIGRPSVYLDGEKINVDGMYRNPEAIDSDGDYVAEVAGTVNLTAECILEAAGVTEAVEQEIAQTQPDDGMQTATLDEYELSWAYFGPGAGLFLTLEPLD